MQARLGEEELKQLTMIVVLFNLVEVQFHLLLFDHALVSLLAVLQSLHQLLTL
jgi:hypothetical protein